MSRIFLDTNAAIAIMNGKPVQVCRRFSEAMGLGDQIDVSSIVLHELWYGVGRSNQYQRSLEAVNTFLAGPIEVTPFDSEDARAAGEIRALLTAKGTPIGPYDVLIAGQALRHGATLVTANARELRRVPGLKVVDWTRK